MYYDNTPISRKARFTETATHNQVLVESLSLVAKSMIPAAFGAWCVSTFLMPLTLLPAILLLVATFLGSFGLIWFISSSNNIPSQKLAFYLFAFLIGLMSGPMLGMVIAKSVIGMQIILMSAGITTAILTGVVMYIKHTNKRFDFLAPFLFASLITVIIASVINLFLQLPVMAMVISCVSIVIFIGYLLYDIGEVVHGGETNPVIAALTIFLDVWNIFIHMVSMCVNIDLSN